MNDATRTLGDRTKDFAIRVIRMYLALPKNELARILGRQVVRSGTSPGAHCREAFRARSDAELISKLETALQELDETVYWFELLIESETVPAPLLKPLITEADELMAIIVTSVKTVKRRRRR
ncbi:MAG: four helix bundle protein [Acidobacteria bacterium]|nr:MAG: four helix bundle protein [Acidobacteriota bacterium]